MNQKLDQVGKSIDGLPERKRLLAKPGSSEEPGAFGGAKLADAIALQ